MKKVLKTKKRNRIMRCDKCFITLERLRQDGISQFFIKIVDDDEEAKEKQICRLCFEGW